MKFNQKVLRELLLSGFEFNFGRVSICRLEGNHPSRIGWQVHSDDHRFLFSCMYDSGELEVALDRFCLIVNQIEERKNVAKPTSAKIKKLSTMPAV